MYAVIESGGKQHRVELGSEIQVDRLDVQPGDSITLDRVLLVADGEDAAIGQPVVDGAKVLAEVLGQDRGEKIVTDFDTMVFGASEYAKDGLVPASLAAVLSQEYHQPDVILNADASHAPFISHREDFLRQLVSIVQNLRK